MRDIKNKLTSGKNSSNIKPHRGKSFGYQVLGFGAGGSIPPFIQATGGTITTSGDFKTHIFTGPGTLSVSALAPAASGNPNVSDYFVVAGGGGASSSYSGGGGAGGFRVSNHPGSGIPAPTMSPLAAGGSGPNTTGITLSVQDYTVTVGGGGAGGPGPSVDDGENSTFGPITSEGGGAGAGFPAPPSGRTGGSGGAGRSFGPGNNPPTSPPQGNQGGSSPPGINAQGGGGGAGGNGGDGGPGSSVPGDSGNGSNIADTFIGPTAPSYGTPGPVSSTRYFSGGGQGGRDSGGPSNAGPGGGGNNNPASKDGTDNTGGGAGGTPPGEGNGGSGIVMIRYKFK